VQLDTRNSNSISDKEEMVAVQAQLDIDLEAV